MLQTGTSCIYNEVIPDSSTRGKCQAKEYSWDEPGNNASVAELQETPISKHAVNLLSSWIVFYAINASPINDTDVNRGLVTVPYFMMYLLSLKARW